MERKFKVGNPRPDENTRASSRGPHPDPLFLEGRESLNPEWSRLYRRGESETRGTPSPSQGGSLSRRVLSSTHRDGGKRTPFPDALVAGEKTVLPPKGPPGRGKHCTSSTGHWLCENRPTSHAESRTSGPR